MSQYLSTDVTKVTTNTLKKMRSQGERIAMWTAYDYSIAKLLDMAKIDVILVGDSAANVMAGYKT
ncbi:MAG: 3-methyl-2-oxobutanoate hydroxymethyltransferase, partial [Bacteroidales bacterium]|nr:3-methyl-2-oxobutanoate hydroxymethyltransferase [Bacteroidales bacterium]